MELFKHTLRELENDLLVLLNGIVTNVTFVSLNTVFSHDNPHFSIWLEIEMNVNGKYIVVSVGKDSFLDSAIKKIEKAGIKLNIDKAELAFQNEFYCY